MGKQARIEISYHEGNYNLYEIYKYFFSCKAISYFDVDYFWVDDELIKFELNQNQKMSDIFLDTISKYNKKHIGFNLIFKDIITYHNLNIVEGRQITIGIGQPKMIKSLNVPDFSYYSKIILPYFSLYEFEKIEFSYS
ncbi:MAG TPA: hypothetical protein PK006_13625 [Saprospiraceae bacterium]|nr:hypothetical protein [Saprospiraceae bacterium]